jgi:hypothetical protein
MVQSPAPARRGLAAERETGATGLQFAGFGAAHWARWPEDTADHILTARLDIPSPVSLVAAYSLSLAGAPLVSTRPRRLILAPLSDGLTKEA